MVYVDDVVIYGKTFDELLDNLSWALEQIRNSSMKLNPKKCNFFVSSIEFLGHTIRDSFIHVDKSKVESILKCPFPTTKKGMRSFLGAVNYLRKFIPDSDKLLKPLSHFTKDVVSMEPTE